jgi:hypothetical protein
MNSSNGYTQIQIDETMTTVFSRSSQGISAIQKINELI